MLFAPQRPAPLPETVGGFNSSIPDAAIADISDDKREIYEWHEFERKHDTLPFALPELMIVCGPDSLDVDDGRPDAIDAAQRTHNDLQRRMVGFYARSAIDPEAEALRREVAELRRKLEKAGTTEHTVPDAMELMEESYALAAKYFPQQDIKSVDRAVVGENIGKERGHVCRVRRSYGGVVSSLSVADSLVDIKAKNGFYTPVGDNGERDVAGAIRACVDNDQTVTDGDRLRLRLLEPVMAGGHYIAAGSILYGMTRMDAQRLQVSVTSIEYDGGIIPVDLSVYDTDGGRGLYVPSSAERNAVKEAAASIVSGMGNGISFSQTAGQQVAMDITRGVMTGGSQYLAAKLRQVRVTVRAGYKLLLVDDKDL